MPSLDWKTLIQRTRERVVAMPSWVWMATAAGALALILLVAFFSSGPSYVPLYEGLSAKQGGQVIDKLQKLGIPYQLNSSGSIIKVPSNELAQARLKLGKMGVPTDDGSQAWDKLTQGSLTTSQMAENALSKRALEENLQQAITGIQGVASARVTLALPKSTPFLKSQPHPKASVWLRTTPSGISATQARAIAEMVANSVPGLDARNVTVTDQSGDVLAPSADAGIGQAQQQLDFEGQVESRAARHVEALLAPLIGNKNLHVSTAASIDFSQVSQRGEQYGPNQRVKDLQHQMQSQSVNGQQGVPGALSNQPPGTAIAPLSQSKKKSAKGQKGSQSGKSGQQGSQSPQSGTNKWNVHYEVDHTTTVTQQAPWRLKALSVSVVLNQAAVGANPQWVQKVKSIVSHAIAAPKLKINVAIVPFGVQKAPPVHATWQSLIENRTLLQSIMELLAAVLILLGVARPLARWIRESMPVPVFAMAGGQASSMPMTDAPNGPSERKIQEANRVQRASKVAHSRPEEAAEMLKRWMDDKSGGSDAGTGGEEET